MLDYTSTLSKEHGGRRDRCERDASQTLLSKIGSAGKLCSQRRPSLNKIRRLHFVFQLTRRSNPRIGSDNAVVDVATNSDGDDVDAAAAK